ncbi:MAG TPA: 30S ribosomal protein S20 [Candidatus Paceibacterota bacterium]|jgi:small subunit ribosomal protein S20|nr:30S ribosomal protein S20 [Candidatus Paceibacterota bacterium]HPX52363.1 30S ribosomal protein S20 [Candidatus Paceibacterota bacterium]HQB56933.1 30S ribosomal protein S20 [Candidatus Paceibacterota bacterium]
MAVTKTAKRAIRSATNRRVVNDQRKKIMKESVKTTRSLISKNDKKEAEKNLPSTFAALDKAAKRGIIKKGAASRKKSRLAKAVAKI